MHTHAHARTHARAHTKQQKSRSPSPPRHGKLNSLGGEPNHLFSKTTRWLSSMVIFGNTVLDVKDCPWSDTQGSSGREGPWSALRWKPKVHLSSKVQRGVICRKEKGKAAWGHATGPSNWWSPGSGWKLDFIAFFIAQGQRSWQDRC
jgi:hypothetical protein